MKKNLIFIFISFFYYSFAQVEITIDSISTIRDTILPSEILRINSNNAGLLIPKIKLESINSQNPLKGTVEEGTLVFNNNIQGTEENRIFPGFYYWKNSKWNTLISDDQNAKYITKSITAQFQNDPSSTFNFNGTSTGLGKETDIFGSVVFNDDPVIYNKINNNSLKFGQDGLYLINLNLALEDITSNNQTYGTNSNVEIYMGFTLEDSNTPENFVAEKILTMVPQFRYSGSELIMNETPDYVTQASIASTKRVYTRGRFSYTLSSYIEAKAGQILRLRALQNNVTLRANGIVNYDPESISTITFIKIK